MMGAAWEDLEIDLLLECVYQRFGFDFRGYERTPLKERLHALLRTHGIATFSALQDRIMHDADMGEIFLREMNARTGRLFEDPQHLRLLRDMTVPWLRSHPAPRIWITECVSAEEVCTLAILLDEEGVYERTQLFATGSNETLLRQAATCGVEARRLAECADAHRDSGGEGKLRDNFQIDGARAILAPRLRANITWAQFNLQSDASFNEFHLIVCRRVLADFGAPLRSRILHLFHDSLPMFGQLCVDDASEVEPPPFSNWFRSLAPGNSLYKRVA
jgi:chemotaxis protein methyltransferase CheR